MISNIWTMLTINELNVKNVVKSRRLQLSREASRRSARKSGEDRSTMIRPENVNSKGNLQLTSGRLPNLIPWPTDPVSSFLSRNTCQKQRQLNDEAHNVAQEPTVRQDTRFSAAIKVSWTSESSASSFEVCASCASTSLHILHSSLKMSEVHLRALLRFPLLYFMAVLCGHDKNSLDSCLCR